MVTCHVNLLLIYTISRMILNKTFIFMNNFDVIQSNDCIRWYKKRLPNGNPSRKLLTNC